MNEQQQNKTFDADNGPMESFEDESIGRSVSIIDPNRTPYNIAAEEFTISVNPYPQLKKKIITKHVVRRPTADEEDRRERMIPMITTEAGKVGDVEANTTELDFVPGDRALYDKIVKRVFGYDRGDGKPAPEDGLDPRELIQARNSDGELEEMPVISALPDSHKSLVVNGMFPSVFDIHETETGEMESFSLGAAREWTLRQDIGGREKLEDGTTSPPDFVVLYTFREPTAAELKKFRSSAFAAKSWRDRDGYTHERRTVVLRVIAELFDRLLVSADGLIVHRGTDATGESENFDVRNREHVAFIPGTFKKGAMLKLFTFLQADLGNSQSA